jgi:hypothetical protein
MPGSPSDRQAMTVDQKRTATPAKPRSCTLAMLMWFIVGFAIYLALFRSIALGAINLWAVLAVVVFVIWIAVPIVLKLWHWSSPNPDIETIDLMSDEIHEPFATAYHQAERSMEDIGFRLAGCLRVTNSVPGGRTAIALFENAKDRATALLFTVFARVGFVRKTVTVLVFISEFDDRTKLITSNSRQPEIMPRLRIREGSESFPKIDSPRRLFEIHQASVARYGGDATRLEPSIKDAGESLRRMWRADSAKFLETHYFYHDEKRDVYRPTWRGAFLMSWRLLWPVKPIVRVLRKRRAARLLSELGLEQ